VSVDSLFESKFASDDCNWVTINGHPVCIKDKGDAEEKVAGSGQVVLEKPKAEKDDIEAEIADRKKKILIGYGSHNDTITSISNGRYIEPTVIHAGKDVSPEAVENVKNYLKQFEPETRSVVEHVFLSTEKGPPFQIGGQNFIEGGHYNNANSSTVDSEGIRHRVIQVWGVKDEVIKSSDGEVVGRTSSGYDHVFHHEFGHAIYSDFYSKSPSNGEKWKEAVDAATAAAHAEGKPIVSKYVDSYDAAGIRGHNYGLYTEAFADTMRLHEEVQTDNQRTVDFFTDNGKKKGPSKEFLQSSFEGHERWAFNNSEANLKLYDTFKEIIKPYEENRGKVKERQGNFGE